MNPLQEPEIVFATQSKLNTDLLNKQNRLLYDHLASGKTITCYEARELGILYLNSRISDLRNVHGVIIYDWFEKTSGGSHVKRYSFTPKPTGKPAAKPLPIFDLKKIMNTADPFRTKCNSIAELLGILGRAAEARQVAWLYWANEAMVKDDKDLRQTFSDKSNELKTNGTPS